ncbi:hypothetical protein HD806DRAFT_539894 [Xylariaceae sp. AK1471]|nr:hypothetical protein HD806DRAFT_539894 [Xylariaceae sp. AK1471]
MDYLTSKCLATAMKSLRVLRVIDDKADSGASLSLAAVMSIIQRHIKTRRIRWRERQTSSQLWKTLLLKISLLDERTFQEGDGRALSRFSTSKPLIELVNELAPVRQIMPELKMAFGLDGGVPPQKRPDDGMLRLQHKTGHLLSLGENGMLTMVFALLLSSPTSFDTPRSTLAILEISPELFDKSRKKWHVVVDRSTVVSAAAVAHSPWAQSEAYLEKLLQLVSIGPVKCFKEPLEPMKLGSGGPLFTSSSIAIRWLFTKQRSRLGRVADGLLEQTSRDPDVGALHAAFRKFWALSNVLVQMDGDDLTLDFLALVRIRQFDIDGMLRYLLTPESRLYDLGSDFARSRSFARYTLRSQMMFTLRLLGRVIYLGATETRDGEARSIVERIKRLVDGALSFFTRVVSILNDMDKNRDKMERGIVAYKDAAMVLAYAVLFFPDTNGATLELVRDFGKATNESVLGLNITPDTLRHPEHSNIGKWMRSGYMFQAQQSNETFASQSPFSPTSLPRVKKWHQANFQQTASRLRSPA